MGEIKRDWGFSRTQEIEFEHASDSRGFRIGLEAWESQQRTHGLLAIKCTKKQNRNFIKQGTKRGDGLIQTAQRARGG